MVGKFRKTSCLIKLKKFIYLISPDRIRKTFYKELDNVLSVKKVIFFQLRLKKNSEKEIIEISKKIKRITKKHKVKLIINDSIKITNKVSADGCHVGQNDTNISSAKKKLKKKILGVTCHNSKKLCKIAIENKADYVAFGSFYLSKLKPRAIKSNLSILSWAKNNCKKKIVAIGGINARNYKKVLSKGANYIALSSFIWNNPKFEPKEAIKKFI